MKLIDENESFEVAKAKYLFAGTKRYDSDKLDAFLDGVEFAEQKLTPLFVEFANEAIIAEMNCSAMPIEELFKQFIKEKHASSTSF